MPPPAGVVIGIGMTILGSLFGSAEEEGPSTADMFTEIQDSLSEIDQRLGNMETAISDLTVAMRTITMMTQYNIVVVEK